MSEHEPQSENMKALEQSLNDHMEICRLKRKAKRLKAENARLKAEVARLRKAGAAMADQIYNEGKVQGTCYASNIEAWKTAKEGKPSV